MRDDKSDASPLDGAAGTVSQAAQTAGQIQKTVNQVIQGAGAAQKAAHTSQAAYAATASAQGGAAAAGATTGTALAGPLGTVVGVIVTSKTFWKVVGGILMANLLGIERLSGGDDASYNVVCPFCGDRRGKCNFVVYKDGELANVYHCFHCDAAGNMLTLYVELTGLYGSDCYKKAYHEIQKKLDLGAGEQMEKRLEIQCQKKKQKESLAKPVDYKRRDHTYRELLTLLQLSPQHRKDLLSRGLTETEVANMEALGYKSTCAEESVAIARKLLKRGCRLEGVPGFFMNYHGDWEIAFYQKNNGYLCPVWSDEGLLIAFQIRLDVPYQKRKYVWLSSAKMEKGCSPGSPVSFSGVLNSPVVYVTEGVLKAEAAYQRTGQPYLGNPGVSAYKELELALNRLKAHGVKVVIEANDMDKCIRLHCDCAYSEACADCEGSSHECPKKREKRDHIRKGCLKLYEICEKLGLICKRAVWDTDDEGYWQENYKGIDDWKLREL